MATAVGSYHGAVPPMPSVADVTICLLGLLGNKIPVWARRKQIGHLFKVGGAGRSSRNGVSRTAS